MRRVVLFFLMLACGLSALAQSLRNPLQIISMQQGKMAVLYAGTHTLQVDETASGRELFSTPLAGEPTGVCYDGEFFYVTYFGRMQKIALSEGQKGRVVADVAMGHSPCWPVVLPDGKVAFADRFRGEVVVCNAGDLSVVKRMKVSREPVSLAFCPQENLLVVAHHLPDAGSHAGVVSIPVTFISCADYSIASVLPLKNGSGSARCVTVSPDGRYAVIPHTIARFTVHTSQVEQGWQNTNAISIIDLKKRDLTASVLLDDIYRGAANPWAASFSTDGAELYVTHAGLHEVSRIDFPKLLKKIAGAETRSNPYNLSQPAALENDLSFIADCRTRIPLQGKGPRSLCTVEGEVWAGNYFSGTLESLHGKIVVQTASPPPQEQAHSLARRGEQLFNDASLCFENWQSCASCHPDGRADGFNWDLMNDKLGNPKNAMSLLHSHASPPAMSTGIRPDAEYAVRAGIRLIQFSEPTEEDARAIDAYLRSMKPIPSPYLDPDGQLTEKAKRGEALFREKNCIACHKGDFYSDRKLHDIGTHTPFDFTVKEGEKVPQRNFVTARLSECWRTAPYLHSGAYYTLEELFEKGDHAMIRKAAATMTEIQKEEIIEYILSL